MKIALITLILSTITYAQTLTTSVGETKFENFLLATTSELKVESATTQLKAISHGTRKKKVFGLVPVKVYSAQLLAAKPEALVKSEDQALNSLKSAGPVQLRLTMLRDLSGKQITESFSDALKANSVAVDTSDMKSVLDAISGISEFKKGQTFSIVGTNKADQGILYLQKPDGEIVTVTGSTQLPEQMFSIWFGKPVDDKLADLKKELLK
jgi:hypothetical protein